MIFSYWFISSGNLFLVPVIYRRIEESHMIETWPLQLWFCFRRDHFQVMLDMILLVESCWTVEFLLVKSWVTLSHVFFYHDRHWITVDNIPDANHGAGIFMYIYLQNWLIKMEFWCWCAYSSSMVRIWFFLVTIGEWNPQFRSSHHFRRVSSWGPLLWFTFTSLTSSLHHPETH